MYIYIYSCVSLMNDYNNLHGLPLGLIMYFVINFINMFSHHMKGVHNTLIMLIN